MLLVLAEAEVTGKAPNLGQRGNYSPALARLQQVLGWPQDNRPANDSKAEFERLKTWLDANLSTLSWDRTKQRFVSDATPPGMEALYAAAKKVEAACGFKCLDRIADGTDLNASLHFLGDALRAKPELSAEARATVSDLVAALFDKQAQNAPYGGDELTVVLNEFGPLLPELSTRLMTVSTRQRADQPVVKQRQRP